MVSAPDWIDPRDTADLRACAAAPTGLEALGTADEDLPPGAVDEAAGEAFVLVPDEGDVEGADRSAITRKDPARFSADSVRSLGVASSSGGYERGYGVYEVASRLVRQCMTATRARLRAHPEELNTYDEGELPANHGELEVQVADELKAMLRARGAA